MTTIARPYVTAVFELASAEKSLPAWEAMLQTAASVVEDPAVRALLLSPTVSAKQIAEFFSDVLNKKTKLTEQQKNFIDLLAENHRLAVLPEIVELFKAARAAAEKTMAIEVTSATALDEAYQQKLMTALSKRLQRQVELHCEIDPLLLGGVVIRTGDLVIDGSIRGKLKRLMDFI